MADETITQKIPEMVARVAHAIASNLNSADPDWANIIARAAIAEMLKPTEAMQKAGAMPWRWTTHEVPPRPELPFGWTTYDAWKAMIESALTD